MITCLLLTPFNDKSLKLKDVLRQDFSNKGISLVHPVDIDASKPLFEGILELLRQAEIVIADLSDLNPNVLFETGYVKSLGKPIIILADQKTEVPVLLSFESAQIIRYDSEEGLQQEQIRNVLSIIEKTLKTSFAPEKKLEHFPIADKGELQNPFDLLSAEYMNDSLLNALYTFPPYFELSSSRQNVVLFGPRGCGKTMLLYTLRFRQKSSALGIVGFYVNASRSFRGVLETSNLATEVSKITEYFNLSYLRSFAEEMEQVNKAGLVSIEDEKEILSVFEKKTGIDFRSLSGLSVSLSLFEQLELTGENIRDYSHKPDQSREYDESKLLLLGKVLNDSLLLGTLAEALQKNTTIFSKCHVAYLLDDYSSDWFPEKTSSTINRIIFNRSSSSSFKVATMMGKEYAWPLGNSNHAEAYRDYLPINMSDFYFTGVRSKSKFLKEIVNKRLLMSGSQLDSEEVFGSRPKRTQERADYSGIEGLASIFSGDCATIIMAIRSMARSQKTIEPIPRNVQNSILRSVSTEFLKHLAYGFEWGEYAHAFADSIMRYAMRKQQYFELNRRPKSVLAGLVFTDFDELSDEAKKRIYWLEKAGVLLPYLRGRKIRKYALRKILYPAFGISMVGAREYEAFSTQNAHKLLFSPDDYWKAKDWTNTK